MSSSTATTTTTTTTATTTIPDEPPTSLIIIPGTSQTVYGYSNYDAQIHHIPTVLGSAFKHKGVMLGLEPPNNINGYYVGDNAINKSFLDFVYPFDGGQITNFEQYETFLQYLYRHQMMIDMDSPEDEQSPLIYAISPTCQKQQIEKLSTIFFESFNVPMLALPNEAVLSLLSLGLESGVVVDSGHSTTHITAIHQLQPLPNATFRQYQGGRDLDEYLHRLLVHSDDALVGVRNENGFKEDYLSKKQMPAVKHALCKVAMDYNDAERQFDPKFNSTTADAYVTYTLPDNSTVRLGKEQYQCCEAIFRPSFMGFSMYGLHDMIYSTVAKRCPVDLHAELYRNVVLCGGNMAFRGMGDRVQKELRSLVGGGDGTVNVISAAMQGVGFVNDRSFYGAMMWNSMPELRTQLFKTKQEYDEFGSTLFHRVVVGGQ